VSPNGKSSGKIFEHILEKYDIIRHTGDNLFSDIAMAKKYNIETRHTSSHSFTFLEKCVLNSPQNTLFRKFRLSNPFMENSIEYKLFKEQAEFNIPLLLFICGKIKEVLIKEKRNTVLFLSRDGCIILKLFSFLYPEFKSVYFHSSRIINHSYTSSYIDYIKTVYDKDTCLLFDLHGSFESGKHLWMNEFGHLPRIFIFDYAGNLRDKPSHITSITKCSDKIEKMNQDVKGTLCNFKEGKDIRIPLEHNRFLIEIQHQAMDSFLKLKYNEIINATVNPMFSDNFFWIYYYTDKICKSPDILPHYDSFNLTLTLLANKYKTDKGNSYLCSHYYTLEYEKIVHNVVHFFHSKKIEILEIGLNRDDVHSIPSLNMWNEYFNKQVSLTGFDIVPDFMKFNKDNIRIKIGDQSIPDDLKQVQDRMYHVIIDDGYHSSKHQQVSFQTLWKNVEKGGYYIIEDLHWQPDPNENVVKTLFVFQNWAKGNYTKTDYIYDIDYTTIESIQICCNDKLLIVKKKIM
jgi:hypothetical protein